MKRQRPKGCCFVFFGVSPQRNPARDMGTPAAGFASRLWRVGWNPTIPAFTTLKGWVYQGVAGGEVKGAGITNKKSSVGPHGSMPSP